MEILATTYQRLAKRRYYNYFSPWLLQLNLYVTWLMECACHVLTCIRYLPIWSSSKDDRQHVRNIDEVAALPFQARVTLELPSCPFFFKTTEYLGRILRPGTLAAVFKKVNAIRIAFFPTGSTHMKLFLYQCNA